MTTSRLAAAPEVTVRLLALIDQDASTHEISSLISRDQVMTATLLRVSNSAVFAVRTRLTTLRQAITLVGLARIRDIALTLSLQNPLAATHLPEHGVRQRLWTHSVAVAVTCRMLAPARSLDPAQAYAAGLLHDIGKLVLGFHFGAPYWDLVEGAEDDAALVACEEQRFGCHHAMVGGWLLQVWGLAPTLVAPAALHHSPPHGADLTALVAAADQLVQLSDARDPGSALPMFLAALLPADRREDVFHAIAAEQQAVTTLFAA